jgi:hypothetical protein
MRNLFFSVLGLCHTVCNNLQDSGAKKNKLVRNLENTSIFTARRLFLNQI